jgi:homoserine kinase
MKNILGILGAVSFVISGSLLGATVFSVMWLRNTENQEKIKNEIMEDIKKSLPKLPKSTGFSIPTVK